MSVQLFRVGKVSPTSDAIKAADSLFLALPDTVMESG
jgi:hypothetical protein